MNKLKVRRLLETAKLPYRAHADDTGYDICATQVVDTNMQVIVHTGISVQPESGYYVEVVPRSSISKKRLQLANSLGIIDAGYTGEIILVFNKLPLVDYLGHVYMPPSDPFNHGVTEGEKIAQLIIRRREDVEIVEVNGLEETKRSDAGFGSTGVK